MARDRGARAHRRGGTRVRLRVTWCSGCMAVRRWPTSAVGRSSPALGRRWCATRCTVRGRRTPPGPARRSRPRPVCSSARSEDPGLGMRGRAPSTAPSASALNDVDGAVGPPERLPRLAEGRRLSRAVRWFAVSDPRVRVSRAASQLDVYRTRAAPTLAAPGPPVPERADGPGRLSPVVASPPSSSVRSEDDVARRRWTTDRARGGPAAPVLVGAGAVEDRAAGARRLASGELDSGGRGGPAPRAHRGRRRRHDGPGRPDGEPRQQQVHERSDGERVARACPHPRCRRAATRSAPRRPRCRRGRGAPTTRCARRSPS